MSHGDAVRQASELLTLRRAVAPLVLGGSYLAGRWRDAAAVGPAAWAAFLRSERCALPLQAALAGQPATSEVAGHLAAPARRELARVLVARRHLRRVAELASAHAIRVIVLKGGVAAAGPSPLVLHDVDVLVLDGRAHDVAGGLLASGWSDTRQASGKVARSVSHDQMTMEIHRSLVDGEAVDDDGLWNRGEAISGLEPLRQLAPEDALIHAVQHVALDHANRRLRLRDLALVARQARRCRPDTVATLFAASSSYPTRTCRMVLDAAVRPPEVPPPPDEERRAWLMYLLASRRPWLALPDETREMVDAWAVLLTCTAWERRQAWHIMFSTGDSPSARAGLRHVDWVLSRCHPALARWWRLWPRWAFYAITQALAAPVAFRASRAAAQVRLQP